MSEKKRLLAVFAHPDDESFGPGGTLAKYAEEGVEVHLLCATRGEIGQNNSKSKVQSSNLGNIRDKELRESADVLGISNVDFLGYRDGEIRNAIYHELAGKIINKIRSFEPQVVLTFDRLGVSGHLDHIGISMITTYAFLRTRIAKKLYYYVLTKKQTKDMGIDDYFIYFPQGYDTDKITTVVDVGKYWDRKVEAMYKHQSQIADVERILARQHKQEKKDCFILAQSYNFKPSLPEDDLFKGI